MVVQWEQLHWENQARIAASDTRLDFALPAGTTLNGRIEGFELEESSRLFLRATRQRTILPELTVDEALTARIDLQGNFVFENVPPGEWSLQAGVFGRRLKATATASVGETPSTSISSWRRWSSLRSSAYFSVGCFPRFSGP